MPTDKNKFRPLMPMRENFLVTNKLMAILYLLPCKNRGNKYKRPDGVFIFRTILFR